MKNLRTAATASIALTAALALSACTPPHQNDSDKPFKDNQSGQSSPSLDIESSETAESSASEQGANGEATGTAVSGSETAATEAAKAAGAGTAATLLHGVAAHVHDLALLRIQQDLLGQRGIAELLSRGFIIRV